MARPLKGEFKNVGTGDKVGVLQRHRNEVDYKVKKLTKVKICLYVNSVGELVMNKVRAVPSSRVWEVDLIIKI